MTQRYQIRTRALFGIDELIEELGGDADAVLKKFGCSRDQIYSGNGSMPMRNFTEALQYCADEFDCPSFGMQLGAKQDFRMLGPLGKLVQQSSTQREAMNSMRQSLFFHNQSEYWDFCEYGDNVYLRRYELFYDLEDTRQYKELAFSACYNILSISLGGRLEDVSIEFGHAPLSDRSVYQSRFKTPIRFNCEQDQWVMPRRYLDKSIHITDADLQQPSLQPLVSLDDLGEDIVYQVSSMIQKSMLQKHHSIEHMAAMLGMTKRTLQRQLKDRGIVFKELLNDIRCKTACWYLTSSDLDITSLSEMLGYSDVSGFSRAFKTRVGISPSQWRQHKNRS